MIREGIMIGNRYEIVNKIGNGGMADVYKAVDRVLNRYVAIKVLKQEFREDESFVKKFRSEAQSAAGLQHPNIVNVYDVAESQGLYYIVMELVEGITLKDYIQKKGRLTPKEVIGITLQVCAGIDSAHSNNIIHRDIKPQNIIISKEGKVKVTDFGIAKATSSNTISTNAMGSVHYTSPEQARGGFSDAKSDIYSLGITMYEMITGELPFDGDSTVSIALKHLQEDIVPPSERVSGVPYGLEQIILKCTQKSPDRRYINIAQLTRDLKRAVQDPHGDFVRISPLVSVGDTRTITQEELEKIQGSMDYESKYSDDYESDYYDERKKRRQSSEEDEDVEPGMSSVLKILTIVAAIVFIGVLVGVLWGLKDSFNKGPGTTTQAEERVPNLVGMSEEQARAKCDELGINLYVEGKKESTKYEAGQVCEQINPKPGSKIQKGTKVVVYICSAKVEELFEIPDVAGMTKEEAKKTLVNAKFSQTKFKYDNEESTTVEKDKVTRTEPAAGESVSVNAEITIFISTGVGKAIVPDVIGMKKDEGKKALEDIGFIVEFEEVPSDLPEGEIVEQSEKKGTELDKGTTIKCMVSSGKEKVTIPNNSKFAGKEYDDVVRMLEDISDQFKIVKDPTGTASSQYNAGLVVRVDQAGKTVQEDATITIVLSTGPGPDTGSGTGTENGTE